MEKPTLVDTPTFNPGDLVAVGDVHGSFDLVWALIAKLRDTGVNLLFLGDLIDRAQTKGGDVVTLNVVKTLRERPQDYGLASVDALRGNHEDMFLDAVEEHERGWTNGLNSDTGLWMRNGGDISSFDEMLPHAEWLRDLPLFKRVEDTVFVHAGLRPYVPLDEQNPDDLVWIRQPFLSLGPKGIEGVSRVVHGHTPNFEEPGAVEITKNRVNIDGGAYFSGKLTAFNHNTNEVFQVYLD